MAIMTKSDLRLISFLKIYTVPMQILKPVSSDKICVPKKENILQQRTTEQRICEATVACQRRTYHINRCT